jgi:hypothetical protein
MALFGRSTPADDQAIARYHYMLKTAPPETIEQAHAEAFAKLTPEQRGKVLEDMGDRIPAAERAQVEKAGASPEALARVATRAEMRQPGSLGGMMAGSLLSSIAGAVIGTMIAQHFFSNTGADVGGADSGQAMDDAGGVDDMGGGDFDV